jgi:hypothetical protein
MISESNAIAEKAKSIYEARMRLELESKHRDRFVAIEPRSGDYYLGNTFIEAALAAKQAHPEGQSFVIRIGHEAAFHIGAANSGYLSGCHC